MGTIKSSSRVNTNVSQFAAAKPKGLKDIAVLRKAIFNVKLRTCSIGSPFSMNKKQIRTQL